LNNLSEGRIRVSFQDLGGTEGSWPSLPATSMHECTIASKSHAFIIWSRLERPERRLYRKWQAVPLPRMILSRC